jgi:hypothetical protein
MTWRHLLTTTTTTSALLPLDLLFRLFSLNAFIHCTSCTTTYAPLRIVTPTKGAKRRGLLANWLIVFNQRLVVMDPLVDSHGVVRCRLASTAAMVVYRWDKLSWWWWGPPESSRRELMSGHRGGKWPSKVMHLNHRGATSFYHSMLIIYHKLLLQFLRALLLWEPRHPHYLSGT